MSGPRTYDRAADLELPSEGKATCTVVYGPSAAASVTGLAPRAFDLDRAVNVETVEPLTIALGAWAEATNPDFVFASVSRVLAQSDSSLISDSLLLRSSVEMALGAGHVLQVNPSVNGYC